MPSEQIEQSNSDYALIRVSRELLAKADGEWSPPVQGLLDRQADGTFEMVFRRIDPIEDLLLAYTASIDAGDMTTDEDLAEMDVIAALRAFREERGL